jgi:hypothetical protein
VAAVAKKSKQVGREIAMVEYTIYGRATVKQADST